MLIGSKVKAGGIFPPASPLGEDRKEFILFCSDCGSECIKVGYKAWYCPDCKEDFDEFVEQRAAKFDDGV